MLEIKTDTEIWKDTNRKDYGYKQWISVESEIEALKQCISPLHIAQHIRKLKGKQNDQQN